MMLESLHTCKALSGQQCPLSGLAGLIGWLAFVHFGEPRIHVSIFMQLVCSYAQDANVWVN